MKNYKLISCLLITCILIIIVFVFKNINIDEDMIR